MSFRDVCIRGKNRAGTMAGRVAMRDLAMRLLRLNAGNNLKTYSRCYTRSSSFSPWFCADSGSPQTNNAWKQLSGRCFGEGSRIVFRAYSGSQGVTGGPTGTDPGVFGDLTAQSGITDDMLDSLIALKDFGDIEGLPPLDVILEQDEERDRKAIRRELEKKKQLELASKRVKTVDELGRSYATGRRKTSTARVWLMEGDGKITINGKPHDVHFPDIDQRVQILEPFLQTNQLGVFNVRATVKGGGISGQSGALRHGISKALQLYDPNFRQPLKSAGILTRDSRVVERKKPGKAKARKSYQWVKR